MNAFRAGRKPSKYKNVRVTYNGAPYHSKAEAAYAEGLDLQVKAGAIRGWIRQATFHLGCPENSYRVDFLVWENDGSCHAVDVKGMETSKFVQDKKLWAAYGPCPLYIVKGKKVVQVIEGKAATT